MDIPLKVALQLTIAKFLLPRRKKGSTEAGRRVGTGRAWNNHGGGYVNHGGRWAPGRAAVAEEAQPQVPEAVSGLLRPRPLPPPPLRAGRREVNLAPPRLP
jgi:hypothetical protein